MITPYQHQYASPWPRPLKFIQIHSRPLHRFHIFQMSSIESFQFTRFSLHFSKHFWGPRLFPCLAPGVCPGSPDSHCAGAELSALSALGRPQAGRTWAHLNQQPIVIINGLASGKIYRKLGFLPLNMGSSCKFSLKPIH